MAGPSRRSNSSTVTNEVKKAPLLGKPVKVIAFRGTTGTKCAGCENLVRNAIMFDVAGKLFCTRKCAENAQAA